MKKLLLSVSLLGLFSTAVNADGLTDDQKKQQKLALSIIKSVKENLSTEEADKAKNDLPKVVLGKIETAINDANVGVITAVTNGIDSTTTIKDTITKKIKANLAATLNVSKHVEEVKDTEGNVITKAHDVFAIPNDGDNKVNFNTVTFVAEDKLPTITYEEYMKSSFSVFIEAAKANNGLFSFAAPILYFGLDGKTVIEESGLGGDTNNAKTLRSNVAKGLGTALIGNTFINFLTVKYVINKVDKIKASPYATRLVSSANGWTFTSALAVVDTLRRVAESKFLATDVVDTDDEDFDIDEEAELSEIDAKDVAKEVGFVLAEGLAVLAALNKFVS